MTKSRRQFALAAVAGLVLLAAAPLAAQTSDEAAVTAAVEALHQAILAADPAKLAAVSAETLTYGHSAGRLENKAQFIRPAGQRAQRLPLDGRAGPEDHHLG